METPPYARTCFFFADEAEAAANHYADVFGGKVHHVDRFPPGSGMPEGLAIVAIFEVFGTQMMALNGGEAPPASHGMSVSVTCRDQGEVDRYWDGLRDAGGEEGPCGWITDRFGKMWQIIPEALPRLAGSGTPAQQAAVHQAMRAMKKIDAAALEAAHAGAV